MRNWKNIALAVTVPLPSIIFYIAFLNLYTSSSLEIWKWCSTHPIALANALFFFNVDVMFWIISLLQKSTWVPSGFSSSHIKCKYQDQYNGFYGNLNISTLIDLYWTVLPVMMAHYYSTHPYFQTNVWRSRVVIFLTWVWSIRLTHNYFRREGWQWGAREDWRFADMRKWYGKHWWWMSFFAVYVSQQIFLIGICLPIYAVHNSEQPWDACDWLASLLCIMGIEVAYFADTQLYNFAHKNKLLKDLGAPTEPVLGKGLWGFSRHPNYFGEQLWWWGLVIFAWNVGQGWTFIGSAVNSCCLAYVTVVVERKMVSEDYRAEAYKQYQKTTSVWIPWFKRRQRIYNDKKSF